MKKIITLLCVLSIIACKEKIEESKDYATISGQITDKNSDSVVLRTRTYSKTIKVNEDGTFRDTLKVEAGRYNFYDGGESSNLYLRNGYELSMTLDTKMFDETIAYSGIGAESSNYLAKKSLMEETIYPPSLYDFEEDDFKANISKINSELTTFLENNKDIDSALYTSEKSELDKFYDRMLDNYTKQKEYEKNRAAQFAHLIGISSPTFEDYENYKGGTTSLNDLKGKYVYIDIWATWCGPCVREIPSLKEIEKAYHGKNIEFVSISTDNGRGYKDRSFEASKEGWKKMITEKEMGGIQLFAGDVWRLSEFQKVYDVKSIPRFILIDPEGNIVNGDAPRPSSPKLIELFNSQSI